MRPAVDVRSYYRRHDYFKRYSMDNEKRLKELPIYTPATRGSLDGRSWTLRVVPGF